MKLHHAALSVNNLVESIRFYAEFFGGKVVKEFERSDLNGKAAWVDFGNMTLELWQFADGQKAPAGIDEFKTQGLRHIAFAVENLEKTISLLTGKGIALSAPKLGASGGRYSFTKDPDGIPIELYEVK